MKAKYISNRELSLSNITSFIYHGSCNPKANENISAEFVIPKYNILFVTHLNQYRPKNDNKYPWIRTEMFSLGANERPYFYDNPVIGFAADYKGLENDWTSFIIKFENILRNIEFDTAKIQMETEFLGTYNFFWKSKTEKERFEEKDKLIETKDWYFGYGHRGRWGLLDEELKDEHIFKIDFEYPIKFDSKTLINFIEAVKHLDINQVVYLSDRIENTDKLYPILTYGYLNEMFDYGFESGKGYWIKKLKNIEIK